MIDAVRYNIESRKLLDGSKTILAAVSGGPDSMAMLYCLYDLREEFGYNLVVAHVNHGVRGEFAKRDQDFVQAQSKGLGLDYYTTNVDMVLYGKENKMTAEEAGRLLRYGFFRETLKSLGGGLIAVAHNKNDQAETVMHRIIRGTGLDGLTAMAMKNKDIIRPLLNITRDEIEQFIDENAITTVEDHTNKETVYTRNKIRLELLPYLKENFNPNVIDALYRLSEIAQSDLDILQKQMKKKYNLIVKNSSINSIIFKGNEFRKLDDGERNRLVRIAIQDLVGDLNGFGEVHINNITGLFRSGITGKSVDVARGVVARVSYDDFIIEKVHTTDITPDEIRLEYGENILCDWNMKIVLEPVESIPKVRDPGTIYIDKDKILGELFLRTRKKGDRIKPLGMNGTKKLKDIFIDSKVPRDKRDRIPVISDSKGILWIPGHSISREYVVDEETANIISIRASVIKDDKN